MAQGETYEQFVEKFKPKKTTDDCYTPPNIMEAVNEWVAEKYGRDKTKFVRPFWPGGDYENFDYPKGCTVVDNPPFSLYSRIVEFYAWKGIKFFIFCPSLTCISSTLVQRNACAIPADVNVLYENGAEVNTGFCTNLESDIVLKSEPELRRRLVEADKENRKEIKKQVPKYSYPDYVVTAAMVQKYSKYGIPYAVKRSDCIRIRSLDAQSAAKKSIFGNGLLLSEKAAAEKAAAEKAAAEKAAAHVWELSDREKELVAMISKGADE